MTNRSASAGVRVGRAGRVPDVLRKVFITLITGGVAFAITNITNQEPALAVTLSVLIGGVTLLVQFLIEFEYRLREVQNGQIDQARHIEECVDERFRAISDATELFGLIEESAIQTELLSQVVRHATQIGPAVPELAHRFAHREIARVSEFLKDLGDGGEVTYDGEDRDWLLGLTCSATDSILATSLTTVDGGRRFLDGGLWVTDLGQRYLDAQREAVQRGVKVRRVFIPDRSDLTREGGLDDVCRQHVAIGVDVRILDLSMASHLRRTSLFDFVIFDGVVSYEVTTGSWIDENVRPIVVNTRLVLRGSRVDERVGRFEELWEAAVPLG